MTCGSQQEGAITRGRQHAVRCGIEQSPVEALGALALPERERLASPQFSGAGVATKSRAPTPIQQDRMSTLFKSSMYASVVHSKRECLVEAWCRKVVRFLRLYQDLRIPKATCQLSINSVIRWQWKWKSYCPNSLQTLTRLSVSHVHVQCDSLLVYHCLLNTARGFCKLNIVSGEVGMGKEPDPVPLPGRRCPRLTPAPTQLSQQK